MTVADIVLANRRLNPNKIYAGVIINIPSVGSLPEQLLNAIEEAYYQADKAQAGDGTNEHLTPGKEYRVRSGDSLAKIARDASTYAGQISVQDILEANPEMDSAALRIGQEIMIPVPKN